MLRELIRGTRRIVDAAYARIILKRKKEAAFWAPISFAATLLAVRLIVYYLGPYAYLYVYDIHVHHFT